MNEYKKITKEDIKSTFKNLKRSYKFIKNNKKSLILCIILSVLSLPISILTPILSARLLLTLNEGLYDSLLKIAAFLFIVYSIGHILAFISRIIYKKYIVKIIYDIQKELMKETFNLSCQTFDENGKRKGGYYESKT